MTETNIAPTTTIDLARREAFLSIFDLWVRYVELGGNAPLDRVHDWLDGVATPPAPDHDVIVLAINERLVELDLVPATRYTDEIATKEPALDGVAAVTTPTVSVVIPTLNEAANLPYVLSRLGPEITEVIVVDGRSTDGTVDVALACRPDAKIVYQTAPGKGIALASGFRAVTGDIAVMCDADGSTDPGEIPRFVQALIDGADMAKESRFTGDGGSEDMTFLRKLGNKMLTMLVNLMWRSDYTDLCYGYNAFWSRHSVRIANDCRGFEVETLMNIRAVANGLKITEVPSFELCRRHGVSNLNTFKDGWRVLRTIIAEFIRPR